MPDAVRPNPMKLLSAFLYRVSTGPVAGAGLIIFVLFMALVLPGQSEQARAVSGGAGSPDMSFVYSPADLYRMAEAYGAGGRLAYVQARFTFDAVFPLVYTFFLATCITWLCSKALAPASPWLMLNLLPIAGMAFDYAENVTASLVMLRYPLTTPVIDVAAPALTLIKWCLIGGSMLLLAVLAGMALLRRRRTR